MRMKFLASAVPLALAAAMAAGSLAGCAPHRTDYYDSNYNDYHRWDRREDAAYRRWEAERHLEHVEFQLRVAQEQNAYWAWRHRHPDGDNR